MAKASKKGITEQIAELNALRESVDRPEAQAALRKALSAARAPLCAAAANIVAEAELSGFDAALLSAFDYWLEQPGKGDPGAAAKTACVRALYRVGARTHGAYLRGVRFVQLEPGWGAPQDSAVELRGLSALALVRTGYFDALVEIGELLADPEPMARLAAAQAVAYSERQDVGVPLLRFKARTGDADPRVLSACLAGLLHLAPDSSLSFVESFIDESKPETAEAALLALGESRLPAALDSLRRSAHSTLSQELRSVAFVAMGLLRSDAAWDYLLSVISEEHASSAGLALSALSAYRRVDSLRQRVLSAVQRRGQAALIGEAERLFALET
jgi:hypothetical protein